MRRNSLNRHSPLPAIKSPTQEPESKPKTTAGTGPTTSAYKLKDLPLEEVFSELETRVNRLKSFRKFSNSDCSDDLQYLNAATRCGSNPEVSCAT